MPYFTTIKTVRHLTSGLEVWSHYIIDRTFAMAEGSVHTQDSDGTRLSYSSSTLYNIISDQDDLELSAHDIVQPWHPYIALSDYSQIQILLIKNTEVNNL